VTHSIIDSWVVPNPPEISRLWPEHLAHVFRVFRREHMLAGTTVDEFLITMDEAGIGASILTGLVEDSFVISNDDVAAWVAEAPTRLFGRACVDPRKPSAALAELRRAVEDLGFRSLQVLPYAFGLPFSHRIYYPLYAACVEYGIPVVTQVGHTASLMPSDPGRPIYLDDVALDFPDLVIVGGHIGWPWTSEMIALALKHPNVYIETSGHLPRRYPDEFVDFLKGPGAEKCLFGTDWPWIDPVRAVAQVGDLGLSADAESKFMSENAARVFGLTLP
jgi:predicted TIM-barrel fold metal-dependent hydrolase